MDDYISVEAARRQLGISPREMFMLLEAEALRSRKDPDNETIRWVSAEDVREATEYLSHFRQEAQERRHLMLGTLTESENQTESREISYFTFSDADLTLLLWASVPYFDAKRDIYFGGVDQHSSAMKTLSVVEQLYSKLEKETKAGRSISEIVEEIAEQKPDQDARNEVFQYLINKASRMRKQQ
jgi:predicted CopG family antitoxin